MKGHDLSANEVKALLHLKWALDQFFSYSCAGTLKHAKVPWAAWDTLAKHYREMPASLYARRSALR